VNRPRRPIYWEVKNALIHRVLVVDDEENVRVLLRRCLEPEGYQVIEAANADDAVRRVESLLPSVAFCDIHMPGANGLWLADQIRSLSPATAIVLATGDTEIPAAESLRAGVVSYLLKPFRRARVVTAALDGVRWSEEAKARGEDCRPRRLLGWPSD
jgi:CheY-like chemotaxis protein